MVWKERRKCCAVGFISLFLDAFCFLSVFLCSAFRFRLGFSFFLHSFCTCSSCFCFLFSPVTGDDYLAMYGSFSEGKNEYLEKQWLCICGKIRALGGRRRDGCEGIIGMKGTQ